MEEITIMYFDEKLGWVEDTLDIMLDKKNKENKSKLFKSPKPKTRSK